MSWRHHLVSPVCDDFVFSVPFHRLRLHRLRRLHRHRLRRRRRNNF